MSLDGILEIVRLTDVGLMRDHNEDAVASDERYGFVLLADGMGGYNAGEVASEIAVLSIAAELTEALEHQPAEVNEMRLTSHYFGEMQAEAKLVKTAVKNANDSIYNVSISVPECEGMGTTIVLGLFANNQLLVGHIGDSRLYRFRDLKLTQLTEDHSLLQEQINAGLITIEQAKFATNKNLVTRALGVDPQVELTLQEYDVAVGDIYLLCSDGLSDLLDASNIESILAAPMVNLEHAANDLVNMANDYGGTDNISVILVHVKQTFEKPDLKNHTFRLRSSGDNFFGWLK